MVEVSKDGPERWPKNTCEHCGCHYGYHEVGCPALVDDIVESVSRGFADDVKRIMADHPETKPGDMTTEQQCAMVAEASIWRARALAAEASTATLQAERDRYRVALVQIGRCGNAPTDYRRIVGDIARAALSDTPTVQS